MPPKEPSHRCDCGCCNDWIKPSEVNRDEKWKLDIRGQFVYLSSWDCIAKYGMRCSSPLRQIIINHIEPWVQHEGRGWGTLKWRMRCGSKRECQ